MRNYGLGVFTFLFLAKQVKWTSVFLYGSSFLAFAAATLDLSQVIARGSERTARGQDLDSVAGFIYAREVLLPLSIVLLNLFFWKLVANCPRGECVEDHDAVSTKRRKTELHSASWDSWGFLGAILKWVSLAALLSVPLLQMLWRLLPGQRQYGSIYVAESTIQTTVTSVFILKCLLNVYISPLDHWWHAFRDYLAPMAALTVGTALGIGNLILFSFTETSLGRFLRAVEVYILILHSLYTTFQNVGDAARIAARRNNLATFRGQTEKSDFNINSSLPFAYETKSPQTLLTPIASVTRLTDRDAQRNYSMTFPRRASIVRVPRSGVLAEPTVVPDQPILEAPPSLNRDPEAPAIQEQSILDISGNRAMQTTPETRPFTAMSYYSNSERSVKALNPAQPIPHSPSFSISGLPAMLSEDKRKSVETNTLQVPPQGARPVSQQASITSLDDLLRQQNELDKSIAALRLFSTQSIVLLPSVAVDQATPRVQETSSAEQSRATLTSSMATIGSKPDSPSNRSDFSLSIFPDPPIAKEGAASKFEEGIESPDAGPISRKLGLRNMQPLRIPPDSALPSSQTSGYGLTEYGRAAQINSAGTQYEITSFIGDLTSGPLSGPSSGPISGTQMILSADDLTSDTEETPTVTTAVVSSALRPMILASVAAAPLPLSASTYGGEFLSPSDSTPRRPLLLGTTMGGVPQLPGRMVPLAQRREKGGLAGGKRPVISGPWMSTGMEATPGAFERPRPPPLVLGSNTDKTDLG